MLSTRIITAVILIAAVLAALFLLPSRWWAIVSFLVVLLAGYEWSTLERFSAIGAALFLLGMGALALALVNAPGFDYDAGWRAHWILLVCGIATLFWVLVIVPWLHFRWRMQSKLVAAVIGWALLIPAWMALVQLRAHSPGRLLAFMAIVWIADTAAYFTGRAIGRHKLAPLISPGKTWEGVAGGAAGVLVYALVLALFARNIVGVSSVAAIAAWVLFAIAVALLSVAGDLFESLQKREAGMKDSGSILPGHGGVLDRIDALLAALPPLAVASVALLR